MLEVLETEPEPEPQPPSSPQAPAPTPFTTSNNRARNALLKSQHAPATGSPLSGLSSSTFSFSSPTPRPLATAAAKRRNSTAATARSHVEQLLQSRANNLAIEQEILNSFLNSVDLVAQQCTTGYALQVTQKITEAFISACSLALSPGTPAIATADTATPSPPTYATRLGGKQQQRQQPQQQQQTPL